MRLEYADWERRRSRSPVARQTLLQAMADTPSGGGAGRGDLFRSALLSGMLPAADGVPPPPPVHPDPMMDFYKDVCFGNICLNRNCPSRDVDPMIEEAWAACVAATLRPLSFSPSGSPVDAPTSPVYIPGAMN